MNSPREHARAQVRMPARVRINGKRQLARLIDVSETGARIESAVPASLNRLELEWTPVPGMAPFQLQAHILWRKGLVLGLRFEGLSSREAICLKALVRHHLNEDF